MDRDQVAHAQLRALSAERHYGYAFRAFNKALNAAADPEDDAVAGAREVLHTAIQALDRANIEVNRLEKLQRLKHVRATMKKLGKLYHRIAKLSKRHGANFQANLLTGIMKTRNMLIGELIMEFQALRWDFSAINPEALPKNFASLEERDQVFEARSIFWLTLSDDETQLWGVV